MYSLVTTVLNDREGCRSFFEQMLNQTTKPTEIIIVDGGSNDGTWELLQSQIESSNYGIRIVVHQEIGCNVARGRDLAIQLANGSTIVSTDIGCDWDPLWFAELIQPFKGDEEVDVVIGSWAVRLEYAKSDWAKVEFARRWPFCLEANSDSLGINRAIAYKKYVWENVGGYPQDLTLAADDVVFDMIIRQPKWGFRFAAAPVVRCYWERHTTLKQFANEERRNFFGAAEAGIWKRHFYLVSGRLLLEISSATLGFCFLFFPEFHQIGILALMFLMVSLLARARTLVPSARRLEEYGVRSRWWRLFVFEYWTKIQGMLGYWQGMGSGRHKCDNTRQRLR